MATIYLCGVGVGLTLGVGDGDGVTFGSGFRSPGPTWPMIGIWEPMARMIGTARELWSWGWRKST
jgi:hypothetical protein